MKRTKHGFTLVELIIVIAVIGVLAAILIPVFSNVIDKANA
ncbi:MAG: prepilin-type N-terminal cleavage/methylation domain-containing protein, partial [Clostridia bacterium]|nr:prepilin-type N-terminal cleavage/methylation domain-containing protein [Clostridia bacterium]